MSRRLAEVKDHEIKQKKRVKESEKMKRPTGKSVLIIEDNLEVLHTFVKHFELKGFNVITATDGMEGLKKIDAGGYDLVITDIVMPFVSGAGVVTTLKKKRPYTPVISEIWISIE